MTALPATAAGAEGTPLDPLDDPNSAVAKRTVYFDFDSSTVRNEDRTVIEAHAAYLVARPSMTVTLECHADERGSREYNLALGERRCLSVRQMLLLLGVAPAQIEMVSYGEEKPAVAGHDESAWRLNRRVEFVYQR
ncbi:MAG TPA: peptidoglycan-associated lipoprotein Pal [Gammaproteobacteria bacterium]|nr:peptidoglycan-associated lipoprotein Pal [Gammaproteobacteria bacterium]